MDALALADRIDFDAAAARIEGALRRTELRPFPVDDPRVSLRLKLECTQETNSFKARGAWNQLLQLTAEERARGVVSTSSGNHGRALAWAARRAGVSARVYTDVNAFQVKVDAMRAEGAEVIVCPTRTEAEERCARAAEEGALLIHPYDSERTIEGAGTTGLEIAREWPEVELVVVPCGGGGLTAGISLALARELEGRARVLAVEPHGSPNMTAALEHDGPLVIDPIDTRVQGLCPLAAGARNHALAKRYLAGTILRSDEEIFAAQAVLVRAGLPVEPAGAAAFAAVLQGALPAELLDGRGPDDPLRVACVVTGGNAEPEQLASLR